MDRRNYPRMPVQWVVTTYNLVEIYRRFRGTDYGSSKYRWSVSKLPTDYTALQFGRHPSSYSPTWEPKSLFSEHYLSPKQQLHLLINLEDLGILLITIVFLLCEHDRHKGTRIINNDWQEQIKTVTTKFSKQASRFLFESPSSLLPPIWA